MLGHRFVSETRKVKWQRGDDVLQVEGTLIYPGTFTGLDGVPTKFTEEALKDIFESIDGNIPFKLTHFSDKIIGYATKFGWDEDQKAILFKGYIFDSDAKSKIEQDGYDHVSGEFEVELSDDGEVVGGILKAIAFVPNPAVENAGIEEAKAVALSKGEEVKEMAERPTKEAFFNWLEEQLKAADVSADDIKKVMDILTKVIKVPYPYPYPSPTSMEGMCMEEGEKKFAEYEAEIEKLKKELAAAQTELETTKSELESAVKALEEYKAKVVEFKEREFKALSEELKELGITEPEAIVEGISDIEQKIAILQKVKENLVLSKTEEPETVTVTSESSTDLAKLAEEWGMTVEELKEIIGGE